MADTRGLRINEHIRVREVRLVDEEGGKNGIIPTIEALKLARERDLDLVEVSPNANPPVCKILNSGKLALATLTLRQSMFRNSWTRAIR